MFFPVFSHFKVQKYTFFRKMQVCPTLP
jgi:hypothetical protein